MQSVEVPLQDVPPEVASVTSQFIQPKSSAALASLACKLADAVFEDVPESSSSKVVAPKTKVCFCTAFSWLHELQELDAFKLTGKITQRSGDDLPRRHRTVHTGKWMSAGLEDPRSALRIIYVLSGK